jgi:acetyl-CoA carboxylase biotin carboxyl carrier protein
MEKLQELLAIFESSGLSEIEIEEGGTRVRLKKAGPETAVPAAYPGSPQAPVERQVPSSAPVSSPEPSSQGEEDLVTIDSPMVGVFYVAPAPDQPPFVRPGDVVQENQTVCIVEAMKLMNEVTAQFPAKIVKVLAENGEPVEFGQPLFAVEPRE